MWLQLSNTENINYIPGNHQITDPSSKKVFVLISPLENHTEQEVIEKLEQFRVNNLQFPAPGFISAKINRDDLKNLTSIARVEVKPDNQMHSR